MDRTGLSNIYMTLGQIDEAVKMHIEEAELRSVHSAHLDDVNRYILEAQDSLKQFLDYIKECAVCDGMIGDAPRAEVVFKEQNPQPGKNAEHHQAPHHTIHQSCFRTADHELA
jgi:hypothetical protein